MGVDLSLLPVLSPNHWVAHDIIRLEQRRELWPEIEKLPVKPVPKPLSCYVARHKIDGETCYGDLEEDPYGRQLHYTTAGALLALADNENVTDNWTNQAAWAYLAKMPPDWQIVLYWH